METRSPQDIELSTEKLIQDLQAVVRDGEELLRASAQDLSERGMAAREKLVSALQAADATRRRLEAHACSRVRAAEELLRRHPYESVGIAFAIGLLLGIIATRS